MEEDSGEVVASNTSVQTTTVSSMSTPSAQHTQPGHTDRHTVQVIQQAVHRPAGVAQYLQQMYAAQQHHIMLQTLRQHHQPTCPAAHTSVGSTHQSNSQQTTSSPSSANGSSAVPLPSPLSQLQSPTVSASTGTISQQAVLLGNGSAPGSQAQMYLRTQMLILAPAATVAADLPALCSASFQPLSTQVPSLALRTHLPGALSAAHGIQMKATQGQTLVTPLPRMSICPLKSTQLSQALADTSRTAASPALVRHQVNCPPSPKGAPPQFILQSGVAQRQGQPFALRVTSQDSGHPPLSLLTQTTPTSTAVLSHHCEVVSSHTPCDHLANQKTEQQQSVVASSSMLPSACPALPDPPPLHLAPVVDPLCHPQPLSCPPPPPPLTLAPPRLSAAAPPPPSVQRLSLRSIHALAVQSDHMLLSEDELPVAETLAQLPYQNLPPPQTAAVDLKVQPNAHMDAALAQSLQEDRLDVLRHEVQKCPNRSRTPSPPALTPTALTPTALTATVEKHNSCRDVTQHNAQTGPSELSCSQSSRSVIQLAEGAALQPAVRSSSSSSPPASQQPQQASNTPHILTHLIEGFVFTEGLEPFPASLKKSQQAQLPKTQELPEHRDPAQSDLLLDTEQPENSSDSNMDNTAAEDERSEVRPLDLLQCEFCGRRSYTHTFHRSKRFCSMTCIRSFNLSSTDPAALPRAHRVNRWSSRPMGRNGRPPGRVNRTQREHFYRQVTERNNLQSSYRVNTPQVSVSSPRAGEKKCEDAPSPRTTRLHGQVERDGEREQVEREREDCSSSSADLLDCSPALWSVEQVCSYISSLPGCQDVVAEFRSQEIDGQALLLLTEEHLMSAMNIKLGPALKICSQINSLKRH